MTPIDPTEVGYIKLGRSGKWAQRSFEHGEVHLGHHTVPHDLCLNQDWDAVVRRQMDQGRSASKAKDRAREIQAFYTLGSDCLWVTFADGHLWWAFADPEVIRLRTDDERTAPACGRRSTDGARRTSPASRCASTN